MLYLLHGYRLTVPVAGAVVERAGCGPAVGVIVTPGGAGVVAVGLIGVEVGQWRYGIGIARRRKVGCGVVVCVHEGTCGLRLTVEPSIPSSGVRGQGDTSVCTAMRVEIWPFDGFVVVER